MLLVRRKRCGLQLLLLRRCSCGTYAAALTHRRALVSGAGMGLLSPALTVVVQNSDGGAQPQDQILGGVFNSLSWLGEVKLSAVKQFGLLKGDRAGYEATDLAKQIAAAPAEELPPLLQRACLTPPIFKTLFETFHNDEVSLAKIRQVAAHQNVHIDSADKCVEIFAASVEFAGCGSKTGDALRLTARPAESQTGSSPSALPDETPDDSADADAGAEDGATPAQEENQIGAAAKGNTHRADDGASRRSLPVQVNITIDPTMDPEKLEKHLKLLRGYGIC